MASTDVAEMSALRDLTPSEIVLLRCDSFAPLPPMTLSGRISYEANNFLLYLMGLFFCTAALVSPRGLSAEHFVWVRIVAGLLWVGLVALWWYNRRRANPALEREGIDPVFPLGGTRVAMREELVRLALSAALLGSEQRGELALKVEDHRAVAECEHSGSTWPKNSLEERLRRGRTMPVAELVHDWMGDGSNFPWSRALRLMEHSAVLRGISAAQEDAVAEADLARVRALLDDCRGQRPEIWKAMRVAIDEALKKRTIAPRMEQVGQMQVPKFDYREQSISGMDAPEPEPSLPDAKETPAKQVGPIATLLIAAGFLGGSAFTLHQFHPEHLFLAAATGDATLLALIVADLIGRWEARRYLRLRESYGLPAAAVRDAEVATAARRSWLAGISSWIMFASVATLPVAIWGGLATLLPIGGVALLWMIGKSQIATLMTGLSAEAVAARVKALAAAEVARVVETTADDIAPAYGGPGPPIPEEPTAAHHLPAASAEIAELLARWTLRRARFRRVYWIGLAVLVGGYTVIALAFWNVGATLWVAADDGMVIPFGLLFTLTVTGMGLYGLRNADAVEDERGDSRHGVLSLLINAWRVNILLQAPLVFSWEIGGGAQAAAMRRHPFFVGGVLVFLVAHWVWMEWAARRILRELPVPTPRRLVMLRVFGSPAFDDLVTLIGAWRRVGLIEHLEGYDTVGLRSDVRDAVAKGQVDRVLAKDMAEVQEQLAAASTEPDSALLFQRHAFQCTNATWRQAIQAMLDRADAVLMDLSSLSMQNQGCAWELGQLLDRVPLERVTLLVNDSTDLECLRGILERAAEHWPADSPNRNKPTAAWQQIRIGGLSERQPEESYYDWKRRLDDRLDPLSLTGWLLSTARSADVGLPPMARVRWGRQSRWPWVALAVLSGVWSFRLWVR
jgi:hypothetical protein